MMKKISFSFGASLGGSKTAFAELEDLYGAAAREAQRWLAETPAGTAGHGWMALPDSPTAEIAESARWLAGYDSVIQVGIGGSALGNLMLNQALLDGFYNERARGPRFYLADNPDPDKTSSIWERVKEGRVALVGVSKSGATAETMTQFLWYRRELLKKGQSDADVLVITDPERGIFRAFAGGSRCRVMELPPSVGGRYSVLCPAGLVTAAALGVDAPALLAGAAGMRKFLTEEKSFDKNPALRLAAVHLLHERKGRPMSVLMPYSSKMAYFAEWYAQLWAESLGKKGRGTTPVRALGAIDQHSQVQLYTEGPFDKVVTFLGVERYRTEMRIPQGYADIPDVSFLSGHTQNELIKAEQSATAYALMKSGHPSNTITLPEVNAFTVGELLYLFEVMTAFAGELLDINAFDQPGVEEGKNATYALLGKPGYDEKRAELQAQPEPQAEYTV